MTDQYLCRGKRRDGEGWVEGYLYISETNGPLILQCRILKSTSPLTGNVSVRDEPVAYAVDPSTVERCTGLRDKNGNKIWTGDLFLADSGKEDEREYTVEFQNGCFVLVDGDDWDFLCTNTSDGEVIGNIYDNPSGRVAASSPCTGEPWTEGGGTGEPWTGDAERSIDHVESQH